jgi:hypothetical protein
MPYRPVRTKLDFVDRYIAGEFGNRSPTWGTIDEWLEHEQPNPNEGVLYHIRNRVAGGPTFYNVEGKDLPKKWKECVAKGARPSMLYISRMVPKEVEKGLLIQGEVMQGVHGLDMFYSVLPRPMREALSLTGVRAAGSIASSLLQSRMDPGSWDWLNELLLRYPDHVVEFSTYRTPWGTIPNRNTVIWEVRRY